MLRPDLLACDAPAIAAIVAAVGAAVAGIVGAWRGTSSKLTGKSGDWRPRD